MELFGLLAVGLPGGISQNVMGPGKRFIPVARKWIEDGILDNIFRVLSLEAELTELSLMPLSSRLISIVLEQKRGPSNEIGHSRGGASTKIHAVVDAYGYPVYFMISEGQRNDINYAIPLLDHVDTNGSNVLADRGYDSNKLIDYIYTHGGEPTIPSRKGAKFDRYCDWWLYKERHLVENYFLKLKAFRRIATRYDKLASTFLGIICIASILIWLK
ncbi:MAG: IS5 family transposase [Blautia faecis]